MDFIYSIDNSITTYIFEHLHNGVTQGIFSVTTHLGTGGLIWIVTALILLISRKTRSVGLLMIFALIISAILGNLILKPMFNRTRPYLADETLPLLIGAPVGTSFPSGHTITSFATSTALFMKKKALGIIFLIVAGYIAFTRVFLFVHYFSDVVAGAVMGIAIGILTAIFLEKQADRLGEKFPIWKEKIMESRGK